MVIMDIFDAFDLTGCAHSAAQLAGCAEDRVWHSGLPGGTRAGQGLPVAWPKEQEGASRYYRIVFTKCSATVAVR